jgi:hypothetical protein
MRENPPSALQIDANDRVAVLFCEVVQGLPLTLTLRDFVVALAAELFDLRHNKGPELVSLSNESPQSISKGFAISYMLS